MHTNTNTTKTLIVMFYTPYDTSLKHTVLIMATFLQVKLIP